ncbi:MAG: beta-N-acetylhexosaminidase [Opitutales bacterium]|nr:beta-N-acetylhexosaminidase [Opitutales bacterium]
MNLNILKKYSILLCLALIGVPATQAQETNLPIIPVPQEIKQMSGQLKVSQINAIYADANSKNAADFLQKLFKTRYKKNLAIQKAPGAVIVPNAIVITAKAPSKKGKTEAYKLEVTSQGVKIEGASPAGAFYGVCTLDELCIDPQNGGNAKTIPAVKIKDGARFEYRGLMMDVARNFQPVENVKKFIELMARYKFNTLHLHLSDDQGWRIEIKNPKFKKLMTVGAQPNKPEGTRGYYTQKEMKDIIAFAERHYVDIVPEIDMPGHNMGAITAYPELTCEYVRRVNADPGLLSQNPKMKIEIWDRAGVSEALLCAGKKETYEFFDTVLAELTKLFPSKYFHLGGDEAPAKCWDKCADCNAFMKKEKIKNTQELMAYFFQRNFEAMAKAGKTALYWYELDVPNYPKNAIMYSWRMGLTPRTIDRAIKENYKVICCPGEFAYLDYPQINGDPNHGWMPVVTLERCYQFDPGYGRPENEQKFILGCEGTLWSEHLVTLDQITYQAFPRALALAEAGWSPMKNRNWKNFAQRAKPLLQNLKDQGVKTYWPKEVYGE